MRKAVQIDGGPADEHPDVRRAMGTVIPIPDDDIVDAELVEDQVEWEDDEILTDD
jgi:hypothetical protein